MNKVSEAVKRELSGWKKWQIFWMVFANAMILGISIYQKDTWLGIAASVTGVICVILCGMGKVSNYFFGTINVVLYAIVALKAKYYGDVMLNLLYYFPTNIIFPGLRGACGYALAYGSVRGVCLWALSQSQVRL